MKQLTNSFEETQRFAKDFAKELVPGSVLLLFGNLGSGKTTFVQGLAKGLGIDKRLISPTFIIVRKYEVGLSSRGEAERFHKNEIATSFAKGKTPRNDIRYFYHIDLYRTATQHDLESVGLPEILQEKDAIVAIEWPEKLGMLKPAKRWELHFETLSENTRSITIDKYE